MTSPSFSSSSSPSSAPQSLATAEKISLVLLPLFLLGLICSVNFRSDFRLPRLLNPGSSVFPVAVDGTSSTRLPDFRLLMGVLTLADRYEARFRLRLLHELQPPGAARIDVRFVLCNLTTDEQRVLVALEIMRYGDIIILPCRENMNSGKTYAYFSSLPAMFAGAGKPYDFVMKTDDDTYFRFPELVESLKNQPREDLYWGHVHEAGENNPLFMRGMGYVLSWDLVEWIAASEVTRNNTEGPEDTLVGEWLRAGGRGRNVYSTKGAHLNYDTKPVMYDYPHPPWTFVPRTIAVHRLKDRQKWAEALHYFNVSDGVKPSKFYHLN